MHAAPSPDSDLLLDLLDLERIEQNLFRGQSLDLGYRRVFGGQVLAQALVAAGRTVEGRRAHSLHAYFILPGDVAAPIVYDVERIRDGRSFTTRRIVAIQHGRALFNMAASFQIEEEGLTHQAEMPDVPAPDDVPSEQERLDALRDQIPERLRPMLFRPRPIEFRPVDPINPFAPAPRPPLQYTWFRAPGPLPDDPLLHQSILAYASDYGLLGAAIRPHGLTFLDPRLQAASLDHGLWFHRPFRVDAWLLYVMDGPTTAGARGFTRGSVFTEDGVHVASTTQEGLLRLREQ